ncbi:MAG: pentapeptide repeat-containing protein [Oscillatoriales cyanobacterium C42_A2020_001]|nr:pentapeptide repeat-containing protein [Leptolyngbyaceae cyanobacterium C42_A2020_001]
MSYCLNPACQNPQNLTHTELCQACGSKLLLRDRYRIIQALGQGGFGATFLAVNESLPGQPSCVIKQLRPNANAPHVMDMARELFKREAETLGRIGTHPQIPSLLDYFEENETFFLVQEYVSGSTLQQEVKRDGPLSELQVKRFLGEILPVLDYIHQNRVIHRDIKPANMIRRAQDQKLVLIDFGAVKYQNAQQSTASDQTALTSYAIGTPGFAPPEQMSMRPVPASDIYALGVSCIYLITGKSPKELDYDPTTGELIWEKHVHASPQFIKVLAKMLEISVKQRYKTAQEVYHAVDLVDHVDALAEGMNNVEARNSAAARKGTDFRGPDTGGTPSSPAARLAMQIRTRQQTRIDSSTFQPSWSRGRMVDSGRLSGGIASRGRNSAGRTKDGGDEKKKLPTWLDAEGLQNYYIKGKRDFASHDLRSLSLPKANLAGANFHQSNLGKINLQGANLHNADFGRASLTNANLRDANLSKAYLSYADLEGADLRGADLSGAYLLNANLRGTNLCGANLSGARLTEEQLAMARTNFLTVRPNGKRSW